VNAARKSARANLAQKLKHLSSDDLEKIHQAMKLLRPVFVSQGK
jgi:hypothetical protein